MRLRRDLLLFGVLAVAALAGGWWLLSHQPGGAVAAYRNDAQARAGRAKPVPVSADTFRATMCAPARCALVEAGGMAFLFGAGEGTADSLRRLGLLRPDIDLVLVPEAELVSTAGLPGLARAFKAAGRADGLKINGPQGIVAVVDGANLLASSDAAVRMSVAPDGEDQGLAGRIVFDSGVVVIRTFAGFDPKGRLYRVDFEGKSLILSGCRAGTETILAAARGTQTVAGVLVSGSAALAPGESACPDVEAVLKAAAQGKLAATIIAPDSAVDAHDAWKELVASGPAANARVGAAGMQVDLTGDRPQIRN